MVKTSTQKLYSSKSSSSNDLKPKKAVIDFLVSYSKALEIKKLKASPEMAVFKN